MDTWFYWFSKFHVFPLEISTRQCPQHSLKSNDVHLIQQFFLTEDVKQVNRFLYFFKYLLIDSIFSYEIFNTNSVNCLALQFAFWSLKKGNINDFKRCFFCYLCWPCSMLYQNQISSKMQISSIREEDSFHAIFTRVYISLIYLFSILNV